MVVAVEEEELMLTVFLDMLTPFPPVAVVDHISHSLNPFCTSLLSPPKHFLQHHTQLLIL